MATPLPPSCNYQSGSGARLYIQLADCTKSPWSIGATFVPVFTTVTSSSAFFVGNFSGAPDFSAGFENVQVFTAAGNGWSSTIKGAGSGSGSFTVVMDKNSPIGATGSGHVLSGELYDFVITFGFTEPAGSNAANMIVGRFRSGKASVPIRVAGDAVEITIPIMTHGEVFGDTASLLNSPAS